jgi:hypothetical protein
MVRVGFFVPESSSPVSNEQLKNMMADMTSIEMIDKIAAALRVEPYHLFVDQTDQDKDAALREIYPKLPLPMKQEISSQIDAAIESILNRY